MGIHYISVLFSVKYVINEGFNLVTSEKGPSECFVK